MTENTVKVNLAERSYNIIFNRIGSSQCIDALAALPQKNVLLTADSNTARYLPETCEALKKSGKTVYTWVFPAGENSKNMDNAMALCGYASSLKLGRNALFAALGGGVTGDLTGFAASIFMRGVDFIQIPTSLLAMVDSSVGGKTAVDTPHGKNLVGAFHQPVMVIIDTGLLHTLPKREIGSGLAEIIKTAMILDRDFAMQLNGFPADILSDAAAIGSAVRRSCEIKAAVVAADEKESGDSGRVFLNYGHTFGHALEHLSCFRLAHGEAVAVGMDIAAFAAEKLGLCSKEVINFQHDLLKKFAVAPEDFPSSAVKKDAERIVDLMKGDKKNGDGKFRAVLPRQIGKVETVDLDPQWTVSMLKEYFSFRFDPAHCAADERREAAVIGLGLLGSSLVQSLDRSRYLISAWNRSSNACRELAEKQFVEKIYDSPEEAFSQADIVILCLPIPTTQEFIRKYHRFQKPGAAATDIASVKSGVMNTAEEFEGFNFIGSHPMAGTEKSGYLAGFAGLYDNADVFVVPGKYSTDSGIKMVEELWSSLKTHTRRIGKREHDALVAHTSHMLHIIASALTRSILDREDPAEQRRHYAGCATGFRDTSRIASSSPEMWKEICLANRDEILPALDGFQHCLEEMRQSVADNDPEKFAELFRSGRDLRDSWLCYKNAHSLPENMVLCGVKHCGKSTIGRAMAKMLDIPLADSDGEIVKRDGKNRSVREIFQQEGEEYFRKLEAVVLEDLAASADKKIIALGGGALSNPMVSAELKQKIGYKIYLDADDKTCFDRIAAEGSLPPFLADSPEPFAAFIEMNKTRREIFAAECDVKICTAEPPHRTALHIFSLYKNHFNI